ncbi:MAG: single-stranded-DNA-specific exonuclease RecJ [Pseudomonadota bacterium]|nr:single-stranded-DNA-specific exonuclease RecJ [Pseudomonadota bacterium]
MVDCAECQLNFMKIVRRDDSLSALGSDFNPVLDRVFSARGLSVRELDHHISALIPPSNLMGVGGFVNLMLSAYQASLNITVVGDYDTDGATATAVCVKGLRLLGFQNVNFMVPNRFSTGYGLSVSLVDEMVKQFPKTHIIVTVDNGISSVEAVSYAKRLGYKVCITDHHCPGDKLPDADVLVNPQLYDGACELKSLAGVGVIFYCMLALREGFNQQGYFSLASPKPSFACLIDLVAFGTIADLVTLNQNNRIIVHLGLQRIRKRQIGKGLYALIESSNVEIETISAVDISYRLAPKLNAAGRMEDMTVGIACLLSDDWDEAFRYSHMLLTLNKSRQHLQLSMLDSARAQVCTLKGRKKGLCLYHKEWHQGVIGILASQLKERYYQPTVVFSDDVDESLIKGSCRSIPGINIRSVLGNIDKKKPGLLLKYGGHRMAAGVSLERKNLDLFRSYFNTEIANFSDSLFEETLYIDAELVGSELCLSTAIAIEKFGIWGQSFEEPLFGGKFIIVSKRILKAKHLKLRLKLEDESHYHEAIWFNAPEEFLDRYCEDETFYCCYRLTVNRFRAIRSLTINIMYMETVHDLAMAPMNP